MFNWAARLQEMRANNQIHQKSNFVKVLDSMYILLGRFYVLFCRMIPLPKVRPIQEVDVATLEKRFKGGDIDGNRVMYISIYYDHLSSVNVTEEQIASWNSHWRDVNEHFEINFSKIPTMLHSERRYFLCGMEIIGSQLGGAILMLNMLILFYGIIPCFTLFLIPNDALHCCLIACPISISEHIYFIYIFFHFYSFQYLV